MRESERRKYKTDRYKRRCEKGYLLYACMGMNVISCVRGCWVTELRKTMLCATLML